MENESMYISTIKCEKYMQFLKELTAEFAKLFWQEIKITKPIVSL